MASVNIKGYSYTRTEFTGLTVVSPSIVNAYFAKKVVTVGSTPTDLSVSFEPITESVFGRDVYIIVETTDFIAPSDPCQKGNLVLRLRTGNTTITGTASEILPLTDGTASADSFTVRVGDTTVLQDTNGVYPYTNIADFENSAIYKISLRPHERATFDTWAENMYNSIPQIQIGAIEIEVEPEDCDMPLAPPASDTEQEITNKKIRFETGCGFTIKNKNVYEIYHGDNVFNNFDEVDSERKRIGKLENDFARVMGYDTDDPKHEVTYFYHDHLDNEHEVCSIVRSRIVTVGARQNTIPPLASRGASIGNPISYVANQEAGATIDASELVMYQNGTHAKQYAKVTNPLPASVFTVNTNNIIKQRWYPKSNQNSHSYLINMDIQAETGVGRQVFTALDYHDTVSGLRIRYGFRNTRRRYANPDVYAGFIGALAQFREGDFLTPRDGQNHFIVGEGFAYQDGSCFPSTNHRNGKAGDLYYLNTDVDYYDTTVNQYVNSVDIDTNSNYDYVNQEHLSNLFYDFGFSRGTGSISENFTNPSIGITQSTRLPHNRHLSTPAHDTHNHLENFQMNLVHSII